MRPAGRSSLPDSACLLSPLSTHKVHWLCSPRSRSTGQQCSADDGMTPRPQKGKAAAQALAEVGDEDHVQPIGTVSRCMPATPARRCGLASHARRGREGQGLVLVLVPALRGVRPISKILHTVHSPHRAEFFFFLEACLLSPPLPCPGRYYYYTSAKRASVRTDRGADSHRRPDGRQGWLGAPAVPCRAVPCHVNVSYAFSSCP